MVAEVDYIGVSLARWQGEEAYNERRMLKLSELLKITAIKRMQISYKCEHSILL
jgi:hypothetical protein